MSDDNYTSPVAQTIDASRKLINSESPATIVFLLSVILFGGMWYFQVTTSRDSMDKLIYQLQELNKQLVLQNERQTAGFTELKNRIEELSRAKSGYEAR